MQESKSGVYVVVGASGGIGSEVARMLNAQGQQVVLLGRSEDKLRALSTELSESRYFCLDASSFSETDAVVGELVREFGEISGAVNCVGAIHLKPAHLTSFDEYSAMLSTNLTTAFALVRAAGKHLQNANIVLLSSAATRTGLANHEVIAAAKGGIEALVRSAAASYAAKQLRFNCVAPGLTDTPMTKRITSNEQAMNYSRSLHALGRIGQPSDIASAIVWLLAAEQSWITAQTIAVDGGLGSVRC